MKKIILCITLFITHSAFAENVIYKCTSSSGEVTYQNNAGDKSECEKTNFASFPSLNFFKPEVKPKTNNKVVSSSKTENNVSSFVSDEQKIHDSKRALILNQELSQEKEQLNTVSNMLKNLKDSNSKDSSQITQLEELKNSHINNINAIQRELGTVKPSAKSEELKIEKTNSNIAPDLNNKKMIVTKSVPSPEKMNLPVSLPNESSNVKVESHKNSTKNIVVKKEIQKKEDLNKKIDNKNNESRKNNKLGTPIIYSSVLSNMSKIKK
jgi:hypothetical protein